MKKIIFFPILLLTACSHIGGQQQPIPVKASDYFFSISSDDPMPYSFLFTKESLKNIYDTEGYTSRIIFCEAQGKLNLYGGVQPENEVKTTIGYMTPIALRVCPIDDEHNCKITSEEVSSLKKDFQCHFKFSGFMRFSPKTSQNFTINIENFLNPVVIKFDPKSDLDRVIQEEAKKVGLRQVD